jgi:hypothetical protein
MGMQVMPDGYKLVAVLVGKGLYLFFKHVQDLLQRKVV